MRAIFVVLAAAAVTAAACGGAAAPSAPSTVSFSADLRSENEVPPIANEEKAGTGKATVKFDLTRDASGKITAAKASVDATLSGFPASAQITIAHIHQAPAGQNGGVKVPLKTDADKPLTLSGGGATFSKSDIEVDPALAQQIIDKPADFYVNFHSKTNAGGVVRGQLTKS